MDRRVDRDLVAMDAAFGILAFTVNRHIVEHMRRIALELEMDFEMTYVYGVLAHLNISPLMVPGQKAKRDVPDAAAVTGVPVRLADVVQVSGLPRETVRRKLDGLRARGKAERLPDGRWIFTMSGVDETVREFTRGTIQRFLRTADEMRAILRDVNDPHEQ